jgi:hypothetical protein
MLWSSIFLDNGAGQSMTCGFCSQSRMSSERYRGLRFRSGNKSTAGALTICKNGVFCLCSHHFPLETLSANPSLCAQTPDRVLLFGTLATTTARRSVTEDCLLVKFARCCTGLETTLQGPHPQDHGNGGSDHQYRERQPHAPVIAEAITARRHHERIRLMTDWRHKRAGCADSNSHQKWIH